MNGIVICRSCGVELAAQTEAELCPKCRRASSGTTVPGAGVSDTVNLRADLGGPGAAPIGRNQFGEYESLEKIARGGMGIVYRAWNRKQSRLVALKVLAGGADALASYRERFCHEVKALGALDHPNIVPLYEEGEFEGQPYYSMKLVEGESLAELLRETTTPFPLPKVASLIAKIGRAVHHAHQRGVLHRDLKPSNILIETASGEPQLIDFGIAKLDFASHELTQSNSVLGTVHYMSPEQAAGDAKAVTVATDVWSLGVILYELLAGQLPFPGTTREEILSKIQRDEPKALRAIRPKLDPELEIVCQRCLIKEPAGRYASAAALAEDLERWLDGEPILVRKVGMIERWWRWCRRRPALAALGAVTSLALLLGGLAIANWVVSQRLGALHRLFNYVADLNIADRALGQGDVLRARGLLSGQEPKAGQKDLRGFEWRLLEMLSQSQRAQILYGSKEEILGVAASSDGKTFLAANRKNLVLVRDGDGKKIFWQAPWNEAVDLALDEVGKQVISASDKGLLLFPLAENTSVLIAPGPFNRLAWEPKHQWAAVANMPNSEMVPSGPVEIWDIAHRQPLARIPAVSAPALCWRENGGELLVVTRRGETLAWNAATREIKTNRTFKGTAQRAAFSSDATRLARIDESGALDVSWTDRDQQVAFEGVYSMHAVNLAFASEGSRLVVAGGLDQRLHVLDIASRQSWSDFAGHTGAVTCVKTLPATDRLLSGSVDGTMRLWPSLKSNSVPQFPLRFSHNVSTRQPQAPVFSADGQYLAMLMNYNRAFRAAAVWSLAEDRQLTSVPGIPIAFVSGSEEVLSWASRTIHRWKRASGKSVGDPFSLVEKPAPLEPQMSEDGRRFFCLAESRVLTVHDVASRGLLRTCPERTDWFRPTPDGGGAIVMGLTNGACYWNVEKNTIVQLASDQRYDAIAISADGSLAAIGGWQGDIRLYALPSGRHLTDLRSNLSGVVSLALSRDRRTLASGSEDGSLRFVNLDSQRETIALKLDGSIDWLRFSPTDDALLAGTLSQRNETNGTYYLWRVPPTESALRASAP